MVFFKCDEFCHAPRRYAVKSHPAVSPMQPMIYADPAPAAVPSQYASYPLPAIIGSRTHQAAGPSGPYPSAYMASRPGLSSGPSRPFTAHRSEQGELAYAFPPTFTGGTGGKLVESEFVQPLQVPEAGTQARGMMKQDALRPRSTTSPATMAPQDSFVCFQRDWQQEVKQLQKMLNDRENQLEEKEVELQDATLEVQKLRKQGLTQSQSAEKGYGETATQQQEAELKTMKKRVELLRHERQELMELLLQKEKQVSVLDRIDPSAKEASALQLGAQAISMVQSAAELRETLQAAEAEIKTLKAERAAADEMHQDTFDKLTDKRREAAELLELVSQRDMKVARVEAYLQQKCRELEIFSTRAKERLQKEQCKREEIEKEYMVAQEQCNTFKANVATRDESILQLQAEVVRRDTLMRHLEARVRVLTEDLNSAHAQLQQLLKGMAAKDAYMQELEAQLRKIDTERQVAYLAEVSKSRKLALDTRIQQDQCRAAINDKQEKLALAKHDLFRTQTAMERIRKAVGSAEAADTCYARSEALQSPGAHIHSTPPQQLYPTLGTDVPTIPVGQTLRTMGADFLLRQAPSAATGSSYKPAVASATSLAGCGPLAEDYYPPYSAVRGDPVDQAVAWLFERPEYRPLAAHVCRLGPGSYLCCMKEVTMELAKDGNVVIKSLSGEKITLASYLDLLLAGADTEPKQKEPGVTVSASAKATGPKQ